MIPQFNAPLSYVCADAVGEVDVVGVDGVAEADGDCVAVGSSVGVVADAVGSGSTVVTVFVRDTVRSSSTVPAP